MEINWFGHSCFRLTERNYATVVTDPYNSESSGYSPLRLRADIVTVSHDSANHNYINAVKEKSHVITGPGEYEIGGVFITGVQTNGLTKATEQEPRNTLFVFDYNGVTVLHLGDITKVPSQTEVEALGPIHVVLVPVGGGAYSLNASKAAEIVSLLEPNIVIPMHYATPATSLKLDPLSRFIKEMGQPKYDVLPSLKITSAGSLPDDTRIVALEYPLNKG
jgi:L-ascorbate metabolism protein UlaG (beta-lactamase superfamily)